MKRVALAWLCLLSVAEISLLQSAAMAGPSEASAMSPSRLEARAAIRSRKLVSESPAEPASSVAGPSEENEGSPRAAAAAEVPLGAEAVAETVVATTKHRSSDKSVAGGGVIIGGLVTAIFAAVFCYIRVTRKRDGVPR
ncbi:uncharacterized protein LOC125312653 [Rhodamnia argentea]|uniref:Uncharacterized protein LOC125312653 n=1 Tax=Rhodamnia argentea TaxID=178133 RepID=A0ABM3GSU6_9MYRT|nr:uncharacterized protein LOC125312653 [Rhodamnia argentea]